MKLPRLDLTAPPTRGQTARHRLTRRLALLAGGGAIVGAVAACSRTGASSPPASSPSPTTSGASATASTTPVPKPTTPTSPAITLPSGLDAVVTALYTGGAVRLGPFVQALAKRPTVSRPTAVKSATGNLKSVRVAVVTAGDDVTLLVDDRGWVVVGGWWPSLDVTAPQLGGVRHVLVLGSDAREKSEQVDTARSDSIHIASVDGRGAGSLLGIARDLWVPLGSGGYGKINSAMTHGGPHAALATVSSVAGVPLEGWVLTGFWGFILMVDALGGLTLNAPRAVSKVGISKGTNHVDGNKALAYARERKTVPDGDFGRSRHQGVLMLALAAYFRRKGVLALPSLVSTVSRFCHTNLSAAQLLTLGAWAWAADPGKVGNAVAYGPIGTAGGGQSVVLIGQPATGLFADVRDGRLGS